MASSESYSANNSSNNEAQPLNIAIIGAGIGGLAAAIGLRRQGHKVTLYEQSRFAQEVGAAIHLTPNANGLLRRWNMLPEDFGAVTVMRMAEYAPTGTLIKRTDFTDANKMFSNPWQLVHRVRLHEALKNAALSEDGERSPAQLHTSSKIVSVDPQTGSLTRENGETIIADLVIGADGVHSRTRDPVVGTHLELSSSGKNAFRFMLPRSKAEADPVARKLIENKDELIMCFGDDRRIVIYPCNDNKDLNFVAIHPDHATTARKEDGWNAKATVSQLLEVYKDFCPEIHALLRMADESTLKIWSLLDMENPETWVRGRIALLGDAAHPFTPHQGQGGAMAIEDGVAISAVLPLGTKSEEVPERLKLYQDIRCQRAHTIQEFSRQAGRDWIGGKPQIDVLKYMAYNFHHDEWTNSIQKFQQWENQQTKNDHGRSHRTSRRTES